mmetsp:Transcript_42212/g.82839  ORF Transcript_42212/g.82839 Transcript_42212/m.82839 type:complete len:208 (-) Transcript_42212:125-748(-)
MQRGSQGTPRSARWGGLRRRPGGTKGDVLTPQGASTRTLRASARGAVEEETATARLGGGYGRAATALILRLGGGSERNAGRRHPPWTDAGADRPQRRQRFNQWADLCRWSAPLNAPVSNGSFSFLRCRSLPERRRHWRRIVHGPLLLCQGHRGIDAAELLISAGERGLFREGLLWDTTGSCGMGGLRPTPPCGPCRVSVGDLPLLLL